MSSDEDSTKGQDYSPAIRFIETVDSVVIGDEISKSLEEKSSLIHLSKSLAENEEEIYKGKTINKYGSFTKRKRNLLPGSKLLHQPDVTEFLGKQIEETTVNINSIPEDFLEKILENQMKTKIFKKYLAEKFVLEHFNFYVDYQIYKREINLDKKQKLGDNLYEQYINPKGKTPIGLSHVVVKKVKKLHDSGSEKGFSQVLQQTIQTLTTTYVDYLKVDYENKNQDISEDSKNEKKVTASKNLDELIQNDKEFKLFEDYCSENYGKILCDCLYSIVHKKSSIEIFNQFLSEESIQPITHNDEILNSAIEKHNSKDESWLNDVKKWIMKTLSIEIYPRFINSKLWKDYISSQFSNEENSNFTEKYQILKLDKDLSTISSSVEILTIRNQITNEIFKVKKIKTSTNLSKNESLLYLDKPRHLNLIHCAEMLKENNDVYKETTLYIIANDTPISLDKFINDLYESKEFLSQLDICDLMFQMATALDYCHEKNYEFDIGTLNEFNMYLTSTLDSVLIDTGFFYDEEIEIPQYYIEDIYGEEKTEKSTLEDVFSLGMVFFRLLTCLPTDEIEDFFEKEIKPKNAPRKPSSFERPSLLRQQSFQQSPLKKKGLLSSLSQSFSKLKDSNEKPPKYVCNMKNYLFEKCTRYDEDLLLLIMRMMDSTPYKRPISSQIITNLVMIKKKTISRPSFISKENSLKRITDGMTFEQKLVVTDDSFRQYFKDFLRIEFCVESILFFEDVNKFKNLKGSERIEKAHEIILSYLSTRKSDLQVNINAKLIKNVSSNLKLQLETTDGLDEDLFDDALGHI
eukprot:gene795-9045_t